MKNLIYILSLTIISCNKKTISYDKPNDQKLGQAMEVNCLKTDWHPTLNNINSEILPEEEKLDKDSKLKLFSRNETATYGSVEEAISNQESIYKIEYRTESNKKPTSDILKFSQIEELILTGYNSENIMGFIKKFDSLTELMISGNYTSKFNFENNLPKSLVVLNLNSNYIRKLDNSLLDLTQLTDLILAHNSIEHINLDYLPPNLKRLSLYNNFIENIEGEFQNNQNLVSLHLGSNCLIEVGNKLNKLKHLEYLELSNNKLNKIPPDIFSIKSLKKLYLSKNCIIELPNGIGNLINLEYLFFDNNEIETIPMELFRLKNIKKLSLRNNNIKYLPEGLGEVEFLGEIDLRGNNFESGELHKIQELKNKLNIKI